MVPKQQKVEKFYFSIGEVAQLFGLNESTLRFWEKEFDEISPRKTKKEHVTIVRRTSSKSG